VGHGGRDAATVRHDGRRGVWWQMYISRNFWFVLRKSKKKNIKKIPGFN
jgi:hypothetical protein